jgi:hypothetical protein
MIDSPTGVVLLGNNRNKVGSTGRGRCSYSSLTDTSARIRASIGVMPLFTTAIAPTVSLLWVLGSLESSEHSDSQQQGSGGCWGVESPDAAG